MMYRSATVLILKRLAHKERFGLLRQFCEFFAEAWRPWNPPPSGDSFNSQNSHHSRLLLQGKRPVYIYLFPSFPHDPPHRHFMQNPLQLFLVIQQHRGHPQHRLGF